MTSTNFSHQFPSQPDAHVLNPDLAYRMEPWYEAYMSALFESERSLIAEKVRRAERLMVGRQRMLLAQSPSVPERKALDKAFHALRALELCLKL